MPNTSVHTRRQRVCSWCPRSFTKEEHLARHVRTHTKEKPFFCTECNKSFTRHDSLLRHIRSHKPGESISPRAANASSSEAINLDIPSPAEHSHNQIRTSGPALETGASRSSYDSSHALNVPSSMPMQQHPGHHHPAFAEILTDPRSPLAATTDQAYPPAWPSTLSPEQQQISEAGPSMAGSHPSSDWVFNVICETPAWLAQEDFDLDALNSAVMTCANQILLPGDSLLPIDMLPDQQHAQTLARDAPVSIEDAVQKEWFTYTGASKSGYMTPDVVGGEQIQPEVDETYRANLAVKLQHHLPVPPLPSTDFLNMCIQTYFTQFHPLFPVIHAPTFRPSANSSLLLLSICSIGSLIVGLSHAKAQGVKIFETLNKAILFSWENILSQRGSAGTPMIQAALIGQTFALLSGRQKDLFIAQTFHGTLLAWARRYKMFRSRRASDGLSPDEIRHDSQAAWRKWVQAEEQNRIAAALHIHDIEIGELFVTDPYLRHSVPKRPIVANDELWAAPTAQEWSRLMIASQGAANSASPLGSDNIGIPQKPTPRLHAYLELEGIAASIIESNSLGLGNSSSTSSNNSSSNQGMQQTQPTDHLVAILIRFYTLHLKPHTHTHTHAPAPAPDDPFCLLALWHSIFISVFTNIDSLELAIGKEGSQQALSAPLTGYVRAWADSANGQRASLHAALILGYLKQLPLATEPAIHVPRVIFRAAIVWYCYNKYQSRSTTDPPQQQATWMVQQFPELREMAASCHRVLFEAMGLRSGRSPMGESSTFCGLVDLLERMGHWGISTRLAGILRLLLPHGDEEER
ncbi:hypothetical protein BJY00DRAFT_322292 [Aspergillus carlsbadensis]|nr:hypothetical protein BJY00DRAFT_322292 [Aspergillus carlsbadensis]